MNPNVSAIVNVVITVLAVLAALSPTAFPSYIPAGQAKDIVETAALATAIISGVNTSLHLTSTSKPGALGK